jgi:GTP diphosphokinase / guanosine-3',5'-bis(diphosphate) 3'-diphosphatase
MNTSEVSYKKIKEIYGNLLRFCRPFIKKEESLLLRKAFEMVLDHHRPTWEESGEEYVYHSIAVAKITLVELNFGIAPAICALLHNVLDNTHVKIDDIRQTFGEEIAVIVDGYVKLSGIQTEKVSFHSENFRKLYLSLVKDIRVILVKLAHRLYDMRNFEVLSEEKKNRFLLEVIYIYIPICHRLGLYNVKSELEELWLLHSNPKVYKSIEQKIKHSRTKQNVYIQEFINPIERELTKQGFNFNIKGRPKSIHSIWTKMNKQNVDFEEVYDLFAIRIIVQSPQEMEKADCWKIYSIVTDIYKPNPQRLRDWISTPKPSGYESLHTTVVGPNGRWVEVQIRSERMDEVAERGLAAHWLYKESDPKKEQEEWMNKIREVIENAEAEKTEQVDFSKIELYSDKIFIFTPEGDLKKLPRDATVLDFAYDIHTSLGDMCSGAKVNGKTVPIRHVLNNGDKVEIMASKNQKPKQDWLNFVTTAKAKSKIRRALNEMKFQEAEVGKEMLRRRLRNRKIEFNDVIIDKLVKKYKLRSSVDLYYNIAVEKINLSETKSLELEEPSGNIQQQDKLIVQEEFKEFKPKIEGIPDFTFIEKTFENLDHELAKCCHPVYGDEVFGFVTVGKGITIHRHNCPNARLLLSKFNYRVIDVKWQKTTQPKTYLTTIQVTGDDKLGILNNITQVISDDFKVNMVSVNVDARKDGKFAGKFKVTVNDTKHLKMLLHKIQKVEGVLKAKRIAVTK